VVVNIENPLAPKLEAEIGAPDLVGPQGVAIQFRQAFVEDRQGLKVLDVTSLGASAPGAGRFCSKTHVIFMPLARTTPARSRTWRTAAMDCLSCSCSPLTIGRITWASVQAHAEADRHPSAPKGRPWRYPRAFTGAVPWKRAAINCRLSTAADRVPCNRREAERRYLNDGQLYTVTNDPPGPATDHRSSSRPPR
jgi:hypothetical protein